MADEQNFPPVIPLKDAPGAGESWDRSKLVVVAWYFAELLFVYNPWQPSSAVRRTALRAFGAKIGTGVIMRPRLRVRFPWKLSIGDHSWIGEGVWIHNQDRVDVGHDAVISQETFITTGSHRYRTDMGLVTRPVVIEPGAWVTARCVLTGGSHLGSSAMLRPFSALFGARIPAGQIWGGNPASAVDDRFGG